LSVFSSIFLINSFLCSKKIKATAEGLKHLAVQCPLLRAIKDNRPDKGKNIYKRNTATGLFEKCDDDD
jgi:hypothetical protein